MPSTTADQPKSTRRPKGPFFPNDGTDSDSDTDTPFNYLASRRTDLHQFKEPDIFDESVEESINDMRNENPIQGNAGQAASAPPSHESTETFVENTKGQSDTPPPDNDDNKVKSEPDSDDEVELMIIDQADASSRAQAKWSVRRPFVIDLVPSVKQEPLTEEKPMLPDMGSQSSLEALERRKKKLQSKALRGALTSDEFDEMMHVAAQLTQAAKAPAAVISPDPHPREQAPEKKNEERRKRKRQAPAADAAQYWARREEKEREREAKNRARRGGVPNTAGKTNQAKLPDDDESDLDESEVDKRNYIQIEKILETYDAIQHRADQGDLPAAPNITATRTNDQLKQMREAAPGYSDPEILGKQVQELRLATKAWGARAVRCKDGNWKVRGLLTPLLSHQLIMGSWMMGRELLAMRNLPRGGILADAMGLGKTLETLSCIVGNQASESLKDAGKGATLVICPSGQMIDQWMLEVKKHCNSRFSRRIVHFKAGDKMDSESLSSFNIVFATYQQVRASIPSTKLQQTMQKRLADPKEYAEWLKEQKGVLHLIEWRRVVLDEAHSIKNHLTHAASACFELKATYRWAVSGTPLINSASELFSYLKLIRCPGLGDFNEYFQKYESTPKARKRRDRLGYQVLYRRIQSDLFLDQPMLSLPTTHPTHQYLTLSAEEMVIFRMMEKCFRNELNQDMESGAAVGQIRSYLVMLLRLRQAATHPFLLEGMMRDYFSLKDLKITKEKLKALKGGPTVYSQIGPWSQRQRAPNKRFEEVLSEVDKLKQKRLEDARQECLEALKTRLGECDKQNEARTGTCQDANMTGNDAITIDDSDEVDSQDEVEEDEDGMVPQRTVSSIVGPEIDLDSTAPVAEDEPQLDPFGRSDFGLKFDMTKQIEYLERLQEIETTACVVCRAQPPKEPVKGRCGCSFCKRCVVDHFSNKSRKCPKCRRMIGTLKPLKAFTSDETDEERERAFAAPARHRK